MTAPARKPIQGESPVAMLMAEMGSKKGFDPMPPDQYLYFLGKKEPPLQRLLALVRKTTIRDGHRSAHCVDEKGAELHAQDLRRILEIKDRAYFKRVLHEAVARGLIRVGTPKHPKRIYLCGSVAESTGYAEGEEKAGGRFTPHSHLDLNPTQRKIVDGWTKAAQAQFYADFKPAVKLCRQVEADALAAAREYSAPFLDAIFEKYKLPKDRAPERRQPLGQAKDPRSRMVALVPISPAEGTAQSPGDCTVPGYKPSPENGTVRNPSSLLTEKTEKTLRAASQPASSNGKHRTDPEGWPAGDAIHKLLVEEYGKRFPHDRPGRELCERIRTALNGAPEKFLRESIRRKIDDARGLGFAIPLAEDIGRWWQEQIQGGADPAKLAATESASQEQSRTARILALAAEREAKQVRNRQHEGGRAARAGGAV